MNESIEVEVLPLPPLSTGGFPIGSVKYFVEDPLKFFDDNIPKHGRVYQVSSVFFKIFPFMDYMYVVAEPDAVKHIMQENNKNYEKSYGYRVLEVLLGKGLLTSEGDFWRKQRRLMQPAFHREKLASLVSSMTEAGQNLVDKWSKIPDGTEIDVSKEFMNVTLEIVCKAMFSSDVGQAREVVDREFDRANEMLTDRIVSAIKIPLSIPTPGNVKEKRSYDSIKKVVSDIIEQRRTSTTQYHDLLAMLMEVQDEDTGERMSNQQIQDEVITIFLAGHETTAVALSWLVHCLNENPEVEEHLLQEEKTILNDRTPALEDVRTLEYTRMVIDETLRLYPPAWVIGRQSLGEDSFAGFRVPPKTNCLIPVYYIHRDAKFWPEPEKFIPERFNKENSKGRHKFVYFPFGGGPRLCIGNNFALMEMQLVLPMILRRFKLTKPAGFQVKKDPLITMRPNPHMKMVLTSR